MGMQWDSDVLTGSSGGQPGPDPQGALESACKRLGRDGTRVGATGRREGMEPGTFKDLAEEEKLKGKGEGERKVLLSAPGMGRVLCNVLT